MVHGRREIMVSTQQTRSSSGKNGVFCSPIQIVHLAEVYMSTLTTIRSLVSFPLSAADRLVRIPSRSALKVRGGICHEVANATANALQTTSCDKIPLPTRQVSL